MMAVVDANLRFQYVEVGAESSAGDVGMFLYSTLMKGPGSNSCNLPPSEPLEMDTMLHGRQCSIFHAHMDAKAFSGSERIGC